MKKFLLFNLILFLLYLYPGIVKAKNYTLEYQQNFETPYENWSFYNTIHTNGGWRVVADPLNINGNSIAVDITRTFGKSWATYNEVYRNFIYQVDVMAVAGEDKNIGFRINDPAQYHMYGVHIRGPNFDDISLEKFGPTGLGVNLVTVPFTFNNNTWYKIKIIADGNNTKIYVDGTIVIDYYDDGTILGPPILEGRIGLVATTGTITPTRVRYDNIIVRDLDRYDVPYFSQKDPTWKNDLYSRAKDKNGTRLTIGSDGCYMTSVAMLLNYYGIKEIPSTTDNVLVDLNPQTLNAWMMKQADGYTANGYFIDNSILRWVDQRHNLGETEATMSATPKLVVEKTNFKSANQNLELVGDTLEKYPLMLKVNYKTNSGSLFTHFLVSSGYQNDKYYILDPLEVDSDLDNLRYNDEIFGTRIYKPVEEVLPLRTANFATLTVNSLDRSALVIASDEDYPFVIVDSENRRLGFDPITNDSYQEIPNGYFTQEGPYADSDESFARATYIADIPTPESGPYKVMVYGNTQKGNIEIFAYDINGDVLVNRPDVYTGQNGGVKIDLGEGLNELVVDEIIPVSFESIIAKIKLGMQDGAIKPASLGKGWVNQLENASRLNTNENLQPVIQILNNVSRQINNQTPKHVTQVFSEDIRNDIELLLELVSGN